MDTVNQRMKPHILFAIEKWCDYNPAMGNSPNDSYLIGSLEASGLATYERLNFDEYYYFHKKEADNFLLDICLNSRPDFVMLSWYGDNTPYNPKLKTIDEIHNKFNIPIVAIWYDSVAPQSQVFPETLLPVVDLNIVVDSTTAYLQKTRQPEKCLPLWVPHDPRIFNNPNLERDIELSFVGSVNSNRFPLRQAAIDTLRKNGIEVYQTGGQREKRVTIEEYANIYKRSKIALNFSKNSLFIDQTKARIFEATLCGALLLENENSETKKYFEPMVDYVAFKDFDDLVDKVNYYLRHDDDRTRIAAHGYQKVTEKYNNINFWKSIFSKIFSTSYISSENK